MPDKLLIDENHIFHYEEALEKIASAAELKHEVRDYANIGKNALYIAKQALHEKCSKCGK